MRERGEASRCFCIVGNCDSLAVVAVAHFDPHPTGRHLAAVGRADDCSVVCSFGLSSTLSKQSSVSRSLFVHSLHLQALVNVSIVIRILRSDNSIQGSLINKKDFSLGCCWQLVEN